MKQRAMHNTSLSYLVLSTMVLISASCSQQNIATAPELVSNEKTVVPIAHEPPTTAALPAPNQTPIPTSEVEIPVLTPAPAPPAPSAAPSSSSQSDELVIIKAGQSAKLSSSTRLDFVRVVSDSRCPAGVQCIWAGEITIELKLHSGADQKTFNLTDHNKSMSAFGMQVELLSIDRTNTASFRVKKI